MRFNREIRIGTKEISEKAPVFIIAEAGVNHNGDMGMAIKMIDAAVEAGVDAVKFQAFSTEHLILNHTPKASYQKETTGEHETQFEMLKKLEISSDQIAMLKAYCEKKKILFLITPFDEFSLDELDRFRLDAYKVSSTDLTNLPFLRKVARKSKPILLSTGMSYESEVKRAVEEVGAINSNLVLFQCTGNYPIEDEEANLLVISAYREKFKVLVGYSDHSLGVGASPYAVVLGARVVEKHFTLDKNLKGPDHRASLDTKELIIFTEEIRKVEKFLGSAIKAPTQSEIKTRVSLQKCLVAVRTIKKGEKFDENNVQAKRTNGKGISPIHCQEVFGMISVRDYQVNDIIEAINKK